MSFLLHHECKLLVRVHVSRGRSKSFLATSSSTTARGRQQFASKFSSTLEKGGVEVDKDGSLVVAAAAEGLVEGTNTKTLGAVIRHGPGDAVLTLNVGGKEFYTLRSTVGSNAVLADHVARAEANQEITKNGAVFIDRDPDHFHLILRHLRNRVELASTLENSSKSTTSLLGNRGHSMTKWTKANIELPKDPRVLRELYTEATFYRVAELKEAICTTSWLANIVSFFSKNSNPFDSAAKFLGRLRAGLIAMGSLGTVGGTVFVSLQQDLDSLLGKLGLQKKWNALEAAAKS